MSDQQTALQGGILALAAAREMLGVFEDNGGHDGLLGEGYRATLDQIDDASKALRTAAAPLGAPVARLDEVRDNVLEEAARTVLLLDPAPHADRAKFNATKAIIAKRIREMKGATTSSTEKQSPAPAASPDATREAMEAAARALADLNCSECSHTPDDPFEPDVEHGETHCTECADWLAAYEKVCGVLGWTRKELIGGEWVAIPGKPKPSPAASLEVEALDALERLVQLKDGPRDAAYEEWKPKAWDDARAVLRKAGRYE